MQVLLKMAGRKAAYLPPPRPLLRMGNASVDCRTPLELYSCVLLLHPGSFLFWPLVVVLAGPSSTLTKVVSFAQCCSSPSCMQPFSLGSSLGLIRFLGTLVCRSTWGGRACGRKSPPPCLWTKISSASCHFCLSCACSLQLGATLRSMRSVSGVRLNRPWCLMPFGSAGPACSQRHQALSLHPKASFAWDSRRAMRPHHLQTDATMHELHRSAGCLARWIVCSHSLSQPPTP